MFRFFSIEKVPFSAAVLGFSSIWLTAFVTFRPNRIAAGASVKLSQTHGWPWIVITGLWIALLGAALLRIPGRTRLSSLAVISSILGILLVFTAGRHAAVTAEEAGTIARVSLGPAFWISLFALMMIWTDTWQKWDHKKNHIILLAVSTVLILVWMLFAGRVDMLSIMREYANRKERFFGELLAHLYLACSSVGLALALGIPLGLLAHRKKRLYSSTFFTLNTLQTIPSLALFGILIPVLAALTLRFPFLAEMGIRGIGTAPAVIALTVYCLLPIARNTYAGFATVEPSATEAGIGMGMTRIQLLFRVEIPIASPVILNGIRVALVQAIGLTAVAALIGAGGMGVFIFQGLGQAADDLILLGAVPTILIAVLADSAMSTLILAARPKGLR